MEINIPLYSFNTEWKLTDDTTEIAYNFYKSYKLNSAKELTFKKEVNIDNLNDILQIQVVIYTNGGYKLKLNNYEIGENNYPNILSEYSENECNGISSYIHSIPKAKFQSNNEIIVSYYTCKTSYTNQLYAFFDMNMILYTGNSIFIVIIGYVVKGEPNNIRFVYDNRKDTLYSSQCYNSITMKYFFYKSLDSTVNAYSFYFDEDPGFDSWTLLSGSTEIDKKDGLMLIPKRLYMFKIQENIYNNIVLRINSILILFRL